MQKKRFLLAGGLNSIHIYNLVRNVLINTDFEITAYHTTGDLGSIPQKYLDLYQTAGITVVSGRNVSKVGKLNYIKGIYSDLKKLGNFDIINLHYVSHYASPVIALLSKNYGRIILTFWGSDLLRSTGIKRLLTLPAVKKASTLQLMTAGMLECFSQTKGYKKYVEKVRVLDFGDMFLDGIDKYRLQSDEARKSLKKEFGLLPDVPVVVIGYVGRPEMQQLKAVQSILEDSKLDRKSFQIALPIYGMKEDSIKELDSVLKDTGIYYKLYPEFMQEEEVEKFRSINDIFIHPQTSDALSSSVVECFYSGGIVINGAWLNYATIDEQGVYYHKFSDFSELGNCLSNVLSNYKEERAKSETNNKIIKRILHWDTLRPQWLSIYN